MIQVFLVIPATAEFDDLDPKFCLSDGTPVFNEISRAQGYDGFWYYPIRSDVTMGQLEDMLAEIPSGRLRVVRN